MKKDLISKIEDFFNFYWTENKMKAFSTSIDKRFMQELPEVTVQQIYIEYVFKDFLYKFGHTFRYKN